jgi:hypothetical protein
MTPTADSENLAATDSVRRAREARTLPRRTVTILNLCAASAADKKP